MSKPPDVDELPDKMGKCHQPSMPSMRDTKLRGGMQPMGGLGGKGGMPGAVPQGPLNLFESLVSLIGSMFILGSAARHSWHCAIL